MSYDRLRSAWRQAWRKEESAQWVYGLVGKGTADDPVFVPTGLPDHLYVRVRNASGSQTTPPARNDAGVGQSFGLAVRMYYEGTKLVIDGVSRRPDLATAEPPPPSGVPVHIHDDRYFTAAEHVAVSTGAADAAKPVVLGATGLLSNTFLDVELASIAALTSAADRLPYYTGLGAASLATFTAFARSFLDDVDAAAVRSTLGLIIGTNVQAHHANLAALSGLPGAADRSVYFTGAGALALYTLSAYGRTLAALADAAALRANINVEAGADVTDAGNVGSSIHGATEKTTIHDNDEFGGIDTEASNVLKWWKWSTIKATLLTYFTTLFVLLAGKAGGQTINGGTASGENLTLHSTAHATKGKILLGASSAYDGATVRLGIGTPSPAVFIHAQGSGTGGGDANQTIIRAENTAAGGAPAFHAKNDQLVRIQFVMFGSTFAGSNFGFARGGLPMFTANPTSGPMVIGTETDQPLVLGTNDVARVTIDKTILLQAEQATLGGVVLRLKSIAVNDDPTEDTVQGRTATTDATVTTLATFALAASTTYTIEAKVTARRTTGTAGAAEDGASYKIAGTFKSVAGAAVQIGATTVIYAHESQAGWDCVFDVTGATVRVRVTGALDNTIAWHCTAQVNYVGS